MSIVPSRMGARHTAGANAVPAVHVDHLCRRENGGRGGKPLPFLVCRERDPAGRVQPGNAKEPMMSEPTVERADLGMAWAVKESFVQYVQSMRDGRILLREGAAVTNTRQFYFPFRSLDHSDGHNFVLQFGGEARFLAHHGLMSVSICNPKIIVGPDGACLSIEQGNEIVHLAHLDLPAVSVEDGINMWANVPVALTSAGAAVFADSYSAGETLAPLTMRAPSFVEVS